MYKFSVFVEKEEQIFIAHNLELWVVSQWNSYDEAVKNLQEATLLYIEDENRENIIEKCENKNYSLTTLSI
jgi:predicted RNase H-like HicB family nuclease